MDDTLRYWVSNYANSPTGAEPAVAMALERARREGYAKVAFVDNDAYNKDPFGRIDPHVVAMAEVK